MVIQQAAFTRVLAGTIDLIGEEVVGVVAEVGDGTVASRILFNTTTDLDHLGRVMITIFWRESNAS